jgi:tRNA(Ile2) C34 agmatinyltransferase TiaS
MISSGTTKQEWICKRCQRASDHVSKLDAERELSQFDCVKPEEQDAD